MRNYEFTVIFESKDELTEKGLEFVTNEFEANKVEVTKKEDLGVKTLAYNIKKQDKGHYFYYEITAQPSVINQISAEMLLQGQILKFLFVVKD